MSQPLPPPVTPAAPTIQRQPANGLGIASLCLGISGLVFGLVPLTGFIATILGAIGLILGLTGRGRVKRGEATNRGVTRAGIITSACAIVLGVIGMVIVFDALEDLSALPG